MVLRYVRHAGRDIPPLVSDRFCWAMYLNHVTHVTRRNEVALAVNGQSNGVQAGYNVEMEAYVQFQIILLRGRIQVING